MKASRRSEESLNSWESFINNMSNDVIENEVICTFKEYEEWTEENIKKVGMLLAREAAEIWYD